MFGLDPLYFVFLAPGLLLALWAQFRVQRAYREGREVPARSGLSGAQAAEAVLHDARVRGVVIEPVDGVLTDHYVPGEKVLRLAPPLVVEPAECRRALEIIGDVLGREAK